MEKLYTTIRKNEILALEIIIALCQVGCFAIIAVTVCALAQTVTSEPGTLDLFNKYATYMAVLASIVSLRKFPV